MAIESILSSVKRNLGITDDYTHFDDDLIIHINSALSILTQVGVGPEAGFAITDKNSKWSDFMGDDKRLNMCQQFVFTRVKYLFDSSSQPAAVLDALKHTADELVWRIEVAANPPDAMVIASGAGAGGVGAADTDGIYQGTTPTLLIDVDVDLTEYPVVIVYVEDSRKVELPFNKDRLDISADVIKCKLTEAETYALKVGPLKVQVKATASDGTVIASNTMVTSLKRPVYERGTN